MSHANHYLFKLIFLSFALNYLFSASDAHAFTISVARQKTVMNIECANPKLVLSDTVLVLQPHETNIIKINNEDQVTIHCKPVVRNKSARIEAMILAQWSEAESVLRKSVKIHLTADPNYEILLKEVVLDEFDDSLVAQPNISIPQSYPIFLKGRFVGVEFPIASTRVQDTKAIIAHKPGIKLKNGGWFQSRTEVYGFTRPGHEKEDFIRYIQKHRPQPQTFHLNYNNYWTSPSPYSESDILNQMQELKNQFCKPNGISIDSFTIDCGWSDPAKIWQISGKRFPDGFANTQKRADEMNSSLGLWVSPSACYTRALNGTIAQNNGFETFSWKKGRTGCCLGGSRYASEFKKQLIEIVSKNKISQVKFDGFIPRCSESGHGHEPNELSSESIGQGLVDAFIGLRQAAPTVWFETTCFGSNPSPWWLFYANSVLGGIGADAPPGRIPSPVYKESYTSAKDYYNLIAASQMLVPANSQDTFSIIQQSDEPILNDAVSAIMRGNMFVSLYVNPKFMNELRWKQLASVLKWAKANVDVLNNTRFILPKSWKPDRIPVDIYEEKMPREVYGYIHWGPQHSLVELRNPWIANVYYDLQLNANLGLKDNGKQLSVVSIYPEERVYGKDLNYGQTVRIPLAPYETVVFKFSQAGAADTVPLASQIVHCSINSKVVSADIKEKTEPNQHARNAQNFELNLKADIHVLSPKKELLVLVESESLPEGKALLPKYHYELTINGCKRTMEPVSHTQGWSSSGNQTQTDKWVFFKTQLYDSNSSVSLKLNCQVSNADVSVWVLASRSGNTLVSDSKLAEPEIVHLDSVLLKRFKSKNIKNNKTNQKKELEEFYY